MAICMTPETWAMIPNVESPEQCTGYIALTPDEFEALQNLTVLTQLNIENFSVLWGFGFITLLTFWAFSQKISHLVNLIYKH